MPILNGPSGRQIRKDYKAAVARQQEREAEQAKPCKTHDWAGEQATPSTVRWQCMRCFVTTTTNDRG